MIRDFVSQRICGFSKVKEGRGRSVGFLLQGCVDRQNSSFMLCSGILPFLLMGLILTAQFSSLSVVQACKKTN